MGQFSAARNKQTGILNDNTLEVHGKELEEANHKHSSVNHPQSFRKYVDSDNEEPEMDEEDPEEEPEEDPEEEPEEDPEEAIVGNENSENQANPGKRRCSKWDQDLEDGRKSECKKGKTMWDADDSNSTLQQPPQLTNLHSNLCEPSLDLEVQSLQKRFSEISSILDPLVDNKLRIGVYVPEKLIKEREKIFLELAKRNAIISKELYVPVKEYPTYNFIGHILGPKGNTQKMMELKTGARIRLRGKDSSKLAEAADEDEDLNVYIEAITQKSLDSAVCMVENLLIPVEEGLNDHKQAQLQEPNSRKAVAINNTGSVCKGTGHNQSASPQKNATLKAACDTCGSFSHPTSGCPVTPSNLKTKSSREIDAANLCIGFLPQTVDDSRLLELFSPFGTISQSRVALNMTTGYSKGYGFVKFETPAAASLAIMHMNGYQIDGHRLMVRIAGTPPVTRQQAVSLLPGYSNPTPASVATIYPTSPHYMMPEAQVSVHNGEGLSYPTSIYVEHLTNLYIGYLPQTVDNSRLWKLFSPFGTITQLKVALNGTGYRKGYGFVRFDTPSAASLAIMHMNGYEIDGHRLMVKIADTPPVRGQPTTNLFHGYHNPGPTAVATSYPASSYCMMQKPQVPIFHDIGIGFPSSFNVESNNQFSQTEDPIISQELSWSTESSTAIPSTVFRSSLTDSESRTEYMSTGLAPGSTESVAVFSSASSVSVSTESMSASLAVVSTRNSALTDCIMPEAQVSILNNEGLVYPSSLNMVDLTNLYVGCLPKTIDDGCLLELFSPFGTVTQSRVILDMVTGHSKGYGFVRFDSPSAADLAIIHMNGYEIDGHRLVVKRKIANTSYLGPPATSLVPVYPFPGPAIVASSCPALPHYMMPEAQVSGINGEGIGFNQFSRIEAPTTPQGLSRSIGSNTAFSSSASVSRSTKSGTTFSSIGLISGSTKSRTTLGSSGLVSTSAESRSVISSYSFSSLFCGDSSSRGSRLK